MGPDDGVLQMMEMMEGEAGEVPGLGVESAG
jgi:hypothetical protein